MATGSKREFLRSGLLLACVLLSLTASPSSAQSQMWSVGYSLSPARGTAPDGAGGVYLVGSYNSGNGTFGFETDIWLARRDGAGNLLWIRQFGTTSDDFARGAAADGAGGLYLCGGTQSALGGVNPNGYDAWVARYDDAGNQLWLRHPVAPGNEDFWAAAPDGSGGVFLLGTGSLPYLAHYNSNGDLLWTVTLGDADDTGFGISPDGAGGVYVAGETSGNFAGTSAGANDAWVARYDGAGTLQWSRQLGSSAMDSARACASTPGGVMICGLTEGSIGGPNAGSTDMWMGFYDAAGLPVWRRQFGTSSLDWASAAIPDGSGGFYVGGSTEGSLFGSLAGNKDAWVGRFDSAGQPLWTYQHGTYAYDNTWSLAPGPSGSFYELGEGLGGHKLTRYAGDCPTPVTYCTAKLSSAGCLPSIVWNGFASATSAAGSTFRISATLLEPAQPGTFFYGTAGAAAAPFQGGYLCMQPPVLRTPAMVSIGSGPCGGTSELEFNAWITSGGDPALQAGVTVQIQHWSRDPADPFGTSLTDALEFSICP